MVQRPASLKDEIRACRSCGLCKVGAGPVPFSGKASSVLIVGEAPGRQEDNLGKPFVGPAGRLLWHDLAKYGIVRSQAMVTNAVCCFPGRAPSLDEVYACRGNLYRQVRHCEPDFILALGRTVNLSFGASTPMSELHGRWYALPWFEREIQVMPTWHPAAVLRNGLLRRSWQLDLKSFSRTVSRGK